jgi:hypothetical protein
MPAQFGQSAATTAKLANRNFMLFFLHKEFSRISGSKAWDAQDGAIIGRSVKGLITPAL